MAPLYYAEDAERPGAVVTVELPATETALLTHVAAANISTAVLATTATIIFGKVSRDTLGEYDSATGIFTARTAGTYLVHATVISSPVSWTATNVFALKVRQNTTNVAAGLRSTAAVTAVVYFPATVTFVVLLEVADQIKIVIETTRAGGTAIHEDPEYSYLTIDRLGD